MPFECFRLRRAWPRSPSGPLQSGGSPLENSELVAARVGGIRTSDWKWCPWVRSRDVSLDVKNTVGYAALMAFAPNDRNGERIVTMLELVHSDDHDEYRLFSLTPNRYYVAARLEDLTRRSVAHGFYPPGRTLAWGSVESPVVGPHQIVSFRLSSLPGCRKTGNLSFVINHFSFVEGVVIPLPNEKWQMINGK
jgi:hypothetical protein